MRRADVATRPTSALKLGILIVCMALLSAGFTSLGVWQLKRRAWKLDLIARTDERVHAIPVDAPEPDAWPHLTAANAEYRHVKVSGQYLHDKETQVKAVTDIGAGYWVLTPLQTEHDIVLINRGFVPSELRDPSMRAAGQVTGTVNITGLLRITEPEGAFLHDNDPNHNRWYSRDVSAIVTTQGLNAMQTAPYFIDADATVASNAEEPIGGLTVVTFYNQHLNYAITWFTLALMPVTFVLFTIRRRRQRSPDY